MKNFQQNLKKLEAADTQVLGVSMDSPFANKAFADSIGVTFPLLSDWGGETTHSYGIYSDKYKAAKRVAKMVGFSKNRLTALPLIQRRSWMLARGPN